MMWGELVARVVSAAAHLLARGEKLMASPFGNASAPMETNDSCAPRRCSRASMGGDFHDAGHISSVIDHMATKSSGVSSLA
jgi:hypothetical protein